MFSFAAERAATESRAAGRPFIVSARLIVFAFRPLTGKQKKILCPPRALRLCGKGSFLKPTPVCPDILFQLFLVLLELQEHGCVLDS